MKLKAAMARYKNLVLLLLGYFFVALGMLGLLLPVMPTTVFFILALASFSKASPRLAEWLLLHPRFGSGLQLWQQHKVIPRTAKSMAAVGMLASYTVLVFLSPMTWLTCLVGGIKLVVMSYIFSRPSKVAVLK